MSTIHRPAPAATTPVEQLPPLTVVTDGIPARERLSTTSAVGARGRASEDPHDLLFRLGIVALAVLVLGSFGYGVTTILQPVPGSARMGLSAQAWSSYRADERLVGIAVPVSPVAFAVFVGADPFVGAGA